ncbi:unnamed protein product [Oikopleura dioica]|uniref:Uncharacterized protein n=1 Tax=Oikopleura dioica TaxID=34765 RepID=E4X1I6_OIKDI|nr:unnamed protein product [Oikopleura dioica]
MSEYSTETTETTKLRQINGPFILVITNLVDESYLRSDDGSTHISATINAPSNNFAEATAQALVNGKMHIFGGESDGKKIARLDDCSLNELPARLYKSREYSHSALSIENGRKALICFGDDVKFCETFDGTSAVKTFAADLSHNYGGLGLYRNQPATVGCAYERHNKAETLSATGWTALPDHPLRISSHSLVGLENQSMLLIGGYAFESGYQTGIWQLKDKEWSRFGKLLQPGGYGSALYDNRFIYFFAGDPHPYAIQRLELNESEKLEKVEVMGNQRGQFFSPVLVKTDYFCG